MFPSSIMAHGWEDVYKRQVTGRVMDAQGELLIGVNVTEAADPSNGVVTDINGT